MVRYFTVKRNVEGRKIFSLVKVHSFLLKEIQSSPDEDQIKTKQSALTSQTQMQLMNKSLVSWISTMLTQERQSMTLKTLF